ncbi:MAG: ZIP family metal transporter [Nanoarchaeota archaeon]
MHVAFLQALVAVLIISVFSASGFFIFFIKFKRLERILILLMSLSAGALIGDAFFHLLPEVSGSGLTIRVSLLVLTGFCISLLLERVIHWHRCRCKTEGHIHPMGYMNLFGDVTHNLIDGVIIGAAFMINSQVGIATAIAVLFHEIPQEIGDMGVLLKAGFSKKKALMVNFLTALSAIVGLLASFLLIQHIEGMTMVLIAIAAGNFIYIAAADLIPELHREAALCKRNHWGDILFFFIGIFAMLALLLLE